MMKTVCALLLLVCANFCFAISPQFWEENTQQQFADGDAQFISISSEGELLLAPQLNKIYEGNDSIIWKIVRDSSGNLYAATGNEGKILKIDPAGKATTFLDTAELEVQAIVMDKDGNLFAATSPEGKIYKIKKDGTSSVFYDPPDKYIWSLAFDHAGNLYAGTGDEGRIYMIDKKGTGKVLIDTNEINITALAWDPQKQLLAGSDRNGILYSVDSTGKAFVLYDTDLQQVTSIYSEPNGEIYFTAINAIVTAQPAQPAKPSEVSPQPEATVTSEETPEGSVSTSVDITPFPVTVTPSAQTPRGGASQLFRMNADGQTELIYTASEDQILDLSGYRDDTLLLSTGKKAKLILVDKNRKSTILLKAPEEQLTNILSSDRILISTANPGNIYELAGDHATKGTYLSDVKDTQTSSTWGRISWKATLPQGTEVRLSTRSGNTKSPDETWSAWQDSGIDPNGKMMTTPKARFIQWKAEFSTADPKISPVLRSVRLAYLQQNIRPEVVSITLQPPGIVFKRAAVFPQESFAGLAETDDKDLDEQQQMPAGMEAAFLGKRERRSGYQTITWNAADENQDRLIFDINYRSQDEKNWRPLAKKLKERVFTWDTKTIPDGTYLLQVVVSDSGSNPKEYALANSKDSEPFNVDNSPPSIQVVKVSTEKKGRLVEVVVQDKFSPIEDLQYSISPGIWNSVFPVDAINDSNTETYRIELKEMPADATEIVLKASDQFDNTATIQHSLR
jgi:hypothetical protein